MSIFSAGDKVSFIHDRLNGVVRQVLDKNKLMVELEDGFIIPVNANELVLLEGNKKERGNSSEEDIKTYQPAQEKLPEIICAAFTAEENTKAGGQAKINVYLINQTPNKLLYTVFVSGQKSARPVASGDISKISTKQITNFPISETEHWREWTIQVLQFPETSLTNPQISIYKPMEKCFKLKPANLLNNTQTVPLLNINGFVENIFNEAENDVPEKNETVEENKPAEKIKIEPFSEVIDLHINTETGDNNFASQIILQQQLEIAQKNIDNAIAAVMPRLILIHGVGNGVLKMELQKIFMRHKNVNRWEDADNNKFGYGATAVYFKY